MIRDRRRAARWHLVNQPRPHPPTQGHPDRLHRLLDHRGAPATPVGQPVCLLGEGLLDTPVLLAEEPRARGDTSTCWPPMPPSASRRWYRLYTRAEAIP
jgi:hypothetical protein